MIPAGDAPARNFPGARFPKSARLTKRPEFLAVFGASAPLFGQFLVVHVRDLAAARPTGARLGITVPKATGDSVRRNAVRRRLRESFRKFRHLLPEGLDLAVNTKKNTAAAESAALDQDLRRILKKAGYLA